MAKSKTQTKDTPKEVGFMFPRHGVTIMATSREEAEKKLQASLNVEDKPKEPQEVDNG